MVWQTDANRIVMLTNLCESGKVGTNHSVYRYMICISQMKPKSIAQSMTPARYMTACTMSVPAKAFCLTSGSTYGIMSIPENEKS